MDLVLFLHILAAIVTLGPLTVATAATPRALRGGAESLPLAVWLHRTTRVYGLATLAVLLLGLGLAGDRGFNRFWVAASIALYLVALGLLLAVVDRDQRTGIEAVRQGASAAVQAARVASVGGAVALIWVVVLALMVWKPGG